VTVNIAPPEGTLPKEYEDIDIQGGDIIKMMNGKRVKTTDAIKKIYEELEIGDEIKLGVKREDEMFIVTFKKADPAEMKGKMMIRREVIDDKTEEEIEAD
jgi:PDZ domain-containing secreted protein